MKTVRLRKIGNSSGFTITKDLMEKYNLKEGKKLYVIENSDGITLTPYDSEFEKWVSSFENTNSKFKNTCIFAYFIINSGGGFVRFTSKFIIIY